MLPKIYSEHAHDDIVDLFHEVRLLSMDQEFNRALFDRIQLILWTRMNQLEERLREELCRELAQHLSTERQRFLQKIRPSSS